MTLVIAPPRGRQVTLERADHSRRWRLVQAKRVTDRKCRLAAGARVRVIAATDHWPPEAGASVSRKLRRLASAKFSTDCVALLAYLSTGSGRAAAASRSYTHRGLARKRNVPSTRPRDGTLDRVRRQTQLFEPRVLAIQILNREREMAIRIAVIIGLNATLVDSQLYLKIRLRIAYAVSNPKCNRAA